jgi:hypothetical protein
VVSVLHSSARARRQFHRQGRRKIGRARLAENRDFLLEPLALNFSADGRRVIAGGGDKIVTFSDAASGKLIRRLLKNG